MAFHLPQPLPRFPSALLVSRHARSPASSSPDRLRNTRARPNHKAFCNLHPPRSRATHDPTGTSPNCTERRTDRTASAKRWKLGTEAAHSLEFAHPAGRDTYLSWRNSRPRQECLRRFQDKSRWCLSHRTDRDSCHTSRCSQQSQVGGLTRCRRSSYLQHPRTDNGER